MPEENRNREFRKQVDLHDSEWHHKRKKEPIFGHGAEWFMKVTIPTILVMIATGYLLNFIFSLLFDSPFQH